MRARGRPVRLQLSPGIAGGEQLDSMLLQIAQQILRLLSGELRFLQRGRQCLDGQETPLLRLGNDPLQFIQLDHGCVRGGQQTLKLLAQLASQMTMLLPVETLAPLRPPRLYPQPSCGSMS